MKIAHIVSTFPPYKGGMGNSVFNFVKILAEIGHDVTVFTPDYGKEFDVKKEEKFKVERLKPVIKFGNAAFLPQLFWKLKGFDVVHLHYPFYGAAEVILLKKFISREKFKLIIHYHMDGYAKGFKKIIFFKYKIIVLPLLARKAEIITCASIDYIKHSSLKKYFTKNKNKFKEVFFGVDLKKFIVKKDSGEQMTKSVLFVGGIDKAYHSKGLDILLKAMKIVIKNMGGPVTLKIIGEGDLKNYYEELARTLRIEKQVKFLSKVDDKELINNYNSCNCLVLPSNSRGEAFGMVLIEAMACAKPVIASDLPGVRSVFVDKKHGLLVRPNDIQGLAEKIIFILKNKEEEKKMGRAGRGLVENKYAWEKIGLKLDLIYKQVLDKKI